MENPDIVKNTSHFHATFEFTLQTEDESETCTSSLIIQWEESLATMGKRLTLNLKESHYCAAAHLLGACDHPHITSALNNDNSGTVIFFLCQMTQQI